MNGELHVEGIGFPFDRQPQRFFRFAILISMTFHVLGFLTSPYWQARPSVKEEHMTVDIADIPARELPKIPDIPVARSAPAPAPRPEPRRAAEEAAPVPPPPPTREMIRERIAAKGLLRALSAGKSGDPIAGVDLPKEIRVPSRTAAASNPRRTPVDDAVPARERAPGIGKQVASSARANKSLASEVFRTDSGLEGEISGGIDDESRTTVAIATAVNQYRSGIKYAYNKELLKNSSLSGKIVVAFVILPDGSVESTEIRQSSVNWPPLEDAVLKRLQHWKFPRSKGTRVRVVFPFVFHPEM